MSSRRRRAPVMVDVVDGLKNARSSRTAIDLSYVLEVPDKETTYCPRCFNHYPTNQIRTHLANDCTERLVTCKEPGCGAKFNRGDTMTHLQKFCRSLKKRDKMALKSKTRVVTSTESTPQLDIENDIIDSLYVEDVKLTDAPSPVGSLKQEPKPPIIEQVLCVDCQETVVKGRPYAEHRESCCRMRRIVCPNRQYGCLAEFPLAHCQDHLSSACDHEKRKQFMIDNSKLRRELVPCTGCGIAVALCELRKHEREDCDNRYVPCRNAPLGCTVNVRSRDREHHESVDGSSQQRSCLYMGAGGAHAFLNEDDLTPPWTVEYWIFRPSITESIKNSLCGIRRRRHTFLARAVQEKNHHAQVTDLRRQLMQPAESDVDNDGVDVALFRREALLLAITSLADEYEDAAVESDRAGRLLMLTISGAISNLEIETAKDPNIIISDLIPKPPGTVLLGLGAKANKTVGGTSEKVGDEQRNGMGHADDGIDYESSQNLTVFEWIQRLLSLRATVEGEMSALVALREEVSLMGQRESSATTKGAVRSSSSKQRTKAGIAAELRANERQRREERKRTANEESRQSTVGSTVPARRRLHERLADDARTIIGGEIIQSSGSSPNKICIDVDIGSPDQNVDLTGGGGRIGFVTASGAFAFAMSVPRGRWAHVAIVCTNKPKKRTICLINGQSAGKVNVSFALPMTAIGSSNDEHSFMGALLDVRIWAGSRSAKEIRDQMNQLVPLYPSAPLRNDSRSSSRASTSLSSPRASTSLSNTRPSTISSTVEESTSSIVCWFTFEDARCISGWSSRIKDVSDQRFHTPISSNHQIVEHSRNYFWLDASSLSTRPIPIPSHRDRNICSFELKRFRLAQKGRALMKEIKCSQGCGDMIRAFDLRFHCKFECLHREVICPVPYCRATFLAKHIHQHEAVECALVNVREKLISEARLLNELSICELCLEPVRLRDSNFHRSQDCEHRIISCPHADCGKQFPAHMLPSHLQYYCMSIHVQNKVFLVKRARERTNYPRPWGIEINSHDAAIMLETVKGETKE